MNWLKISVKRRKIFPEWLKNNLNLLNNSSGLAQIIRKFAQKQNEFP